LTVKAFGVGGARRGPKEVTHSTHFLGLYATFLAYKGATCESSAQFPLSNERGKTDMVVSRSTFASLVVIFLFATAMTTRASEIRSYLGNNYTFACNIAGSGCTAAPPFTTSDSAGGQDFLSIVIRNRRTSHPSP
jgi:hypothetical protein